jgi:hypothetical protein
MGKFSKVPHQNLHRGYVLINLPHRNLNGWYTQIKSAALKFVHMGRISNLPH